MELRQLQIFSIAAETLNFTKTGAKLGYAQSNITSQIRQLEEELQVKLFERLGRRIQLTNEGRKFLENVKQILLLCEKAKGEFSPDVFRGILSIGAAETLCVYRLPLILSQYRKLYPLVEIRVQTDSCDSFIEALKANRIDIALVLTDKILAPELAVQTLYDETLTMVASPLHPLFQKKNVQPHDLAEECLILTLPGCGYRPLILAMLKQQNIKPGSIMELSSVGAIKQCTRCGLGVAFLPKISVKNDLASGKLVELNWTGPSLEVKTQLIYHQEKWITPPMKAFLDLCCSLNDPDQWPAGI